MSRKLFMMKAYGVILLALIIVTSCGDDESNFDMTIKLSYDDAPLVMTNDYTYPDGRTIRFNRVSFFISKLNVSDGTESVQLLDAQHVNLTQSHIDEERASEGYQVISNDVELASINSISFNIGLTADQNGQSPSDYPVDSDLSNSAEYWVGWESYVFAKIEGLIDLDNDGTPESTFALHLGSDEIMRTVDIENLSDSRDSYSLNIDLDVKQIFNDGTTTYDIVETTNIHSLNQIAQANFLIKNLERALENSNN